MIALSQGDAADIASIMPIMEDAFDPSFGEAWTAAQCLSALAIADCCLLLAKADNKTVGFAISRWVLDTEELLMIGVAKDWQRKNIGSILLAEILISSKRAGRTKLFLEVRDGNFAYDFYHASGFSPIGRRKQYYRGSGGIRPDAITMAINI
jgi:ribosomal-protein-alanine N-acetyltransferase